MTEDAQPKQPADLAVAMHSPNDTLSSSGMPETARATETTGGKFQQIVSCGNHRVMADEPVSYGGLDTGLSPYDFLASAVATCTAMTLRVYAAHKSLDLGRISVGVTHEKVHLDDMTTAATSEKKSIGYIDRFERLISIEGDVSDELRNKLLAIADKCPVSRTLERTSQIETAFSND
ncbi:OsmC family protein [uncultured Tateyamaria sp.]|uniref:OsmC family protein n=1 Tax=uncultured Tateyamaria sp. TaxID=455651 RepID=UPI00261D1118|nr:OsmC family protein [uncultured Tateyamaria sp.]